MPLVLSTGLWLVFAAVQMDSETLTYHDPENIQAISLECYETTSCPAPLISFLP
jgi:hypothetical protein